METIKSSFTLAEVAAITGHRRKMIDYLCRTGIVTPSASKHTGRGRGRWRRFTFADLLLLQTVKRLLDQGISVARLRESIKKVRGQLSNVSQTGDLIERFIITDGKNAYFKSHKDIISLIESPDQYVFSFVVDVEITRNEVLQGISKLS